LSLVLDASALLAFLHNETGGETVGNSLEGALISTVNWSEVIQKAIGHGVDTRGMRDDFLGLGVTFIAFTTVQSELAAGLWRDTRALGLSLADRACLSLGLVHECPVMTADRAWKQLDLGLDVRLIR